jgi:hypothetical protein
LEYVSRRYFKKLYWILNSKVAFIVGCFKVMNKKFS